MDAQDIQSLIISISGVLTAIGVIAATFKWWGERISKKIVKEGLEELTSSELSERGAIAEMRKEFTEQNSKIQGMEAILKDVHKRTLRNEIMNLITNHPENVDAIEGAYEEYKNFGYNGYLQELVNSWRKATVKKKVQRKRR